MSNGNSAQNPEINIVPAGGGKVKSGSGAGVTFQFESAKEAAEGEMAEIKLASMKQGITCKRIQNPPPVIPPNFPR